MKSFFFYLIICLVTFFSNSNGNFMNDVRGKFGNAQLFGGTSLDTGILQEGLEEKKELEALPDQIEALETEQAELHEKIADPSFYQDAGDEVAQVNKRLGELEAELETIYDRWSELDAIGS